MHATHDYREVPTGIHATTNAGSHTQPNCRRGGGGCCRCCRRYPTPPPTPPPPQTQLPPKTYRRRNVRKCIQFIFIVRWPILVAAVRMCNHAPKQKAKRNLKSKNAGKKRRNWIWERNSTNWLAGWLAGWMAGWWRALLAGCPAGWPCVTLAGWLAEKLDRKIGSTNWTFQYLN